MDSQQRNPGPRRVQHPWDIDDALLRPGRFDRQLFIPPPDLEARRFLIGASLAGRPNTVTTVPMLGEATALYSGADLTHLVELAVDLAIEDAIAARDPVPVSDDHMRQALAKVRPTTADWLLSARNHAVRQRRRRYDEVASYLGRREVKRALN